MKLFFSVHYERDARHTTGLVFPLTDLAEAGGVYVSQWTKTAKKDGVEHTIIFRAREDMREPVQIRLVFEETDWSGAPYVFAPAALYNGNRFTCLEKNYPPMLTSEERTKYAGEPVISDIPRLSREGDGRVQLAVGDLATPCVGWYAKEQKHGVLVFFKQKNELGDFGVAIKEKEREKTAQILFSSPCIREETTYGMCTTKIRSSDRGVALKAGDTVTFCFVQYQFPCESIAAFQNRFFAYRAVQDLPQSHPNTVPWCHAWRVIEKKYNTRNWLENPGFYQSSEAQGGIYRQWQTGWVGGAINTLPALVLGNGDSVKKSRRTLDFIFRELQHPSGFLYGVYCDGKPYGDDFYDPSNPNIVMSRKNADALYYLMKQIVFLKDSGAEIKQAWLSGVKRLADAFLSFYKKNGELGQLIEMETETPFIKSSASAGIAPAALMLSGIYFKNASYQAAAEQIAEAYYVDFIARGYTNGGPGDILSAPDSESAFGLLESYVVLYSCTKKDKWLRYAVDTASLCAGWCVSYDYQYEKNTQLYRRGSATTGAVWANVQNKHAAPGICTLSGSSLFRLYRATGDLRYLELCRDIAHGITQFVSLPENPIYASYVWHNKKAALQKRLAALTAKGMLALSKNCTLFLPGQFNAPGRINERVNLSDWEGKNNVGEIPHGSCWCEVSAMLTYLELPGIYVQKDTGFCFTLDHVECSVEEFTERTIKIKLVNPTRYDAQYRLFIEKQTDCPAPLEEGFYTKFQIVPVGAGQTKQILIERGE